MMKDWFGPAFRKQRMMPVAKTNRTKAIPPPTKIVRLDMDFLSFCPLRCGISVRGDGGRLRVLIERRHVGDPAVIADDHDLGALDDAAAVVAARARAAARAFDGIDDLARAAAVADRHGDLRQRPGERHRLERVFAVDDRPGEAGYRAAARAAADSRGGGRQTRRP